MFFCLFTYTHFVQKKRHRDFWIPSKCWDHCKYTLAAVCRKCAVLMFFFKLRSGMAITSMMDKKNFLFTKNKNHSYIAPCWIQKFCLTKNHLYILSYILRPWPLTLVAPFLCYKRLKVAILNFFFFDFFKIERGNFFIFISNF